MRNRIFHALLVLLAGVPAALAQGYGPYPAYPAGPAYPSFRTAPPPAWPVMFQTAPGPAPTAAPRSGMSWPELPSYAAPLPQIPLAPPPPPRPAPAVVPLPPAQPAPAPPLSDPELTVESPRQPMLSPLPADAGADAEPLSGPPATPPLPPPPPGAPMVCEPEPQPVSGPELSHELNPPRHGPRGYRFYGSADYLFWIVRERPSPVLLTTGPLNTPGTAVILGNSDYDDQTRNGARATLGSWLTPMQTFGLEATGLWLATREPTFHSSAPVLARPFVNAVTGTESALVLSAPGVQAGAASVSALSRLWGGETNARLELHRGCLCHLDLLAGVRYLEVDDALGINTRTTFAPNVLGLGGTSVTASDRFGGRNSFLGGQVGMEAELHYGRFFVDLWGKIALGEMREVVTINGTTVLTGSNGVSTALPGGLLAQASNSGRYSQEAFAVVPEVGINFGMQLTTNLRARVGYTFLYISNVARGGDQIDRTVNLTGRPGLFSVPVPPTGPVRPVFDFRDTDFWAQGINAGLEFRF